MVGYKGIVLKNGILRSKYDTIFELDVPTPKKEVTEEAFGFTESGYSFCGNIADVMYHEDFLITSNPWRDVRLFEIESIGKVVGNAYHYKAESIIVRREIAKDEILEYFKLNKDATNEAIDKYGDTILTEYEKSCIEPYRQVYLLDEINEIIVKACKRIYQVNLCLQEKGVYDITKCENCQGKNWLASSMSYDDDRLYLKARTKLVQEKELQDIDEYNTLLGLGNCINECKALESLAEEITRRKNGY